MIGQAFYLPLNVLSVIFHDLANPCGYFIISYSSFLQYICHDVFMMSWKSALQLSRTRPYSILCHCLCMSDYLKRWVQVFWLCEASPDLQSGSCSDRPWSSLCVAILRSRGTSGDTGEKGTTECK